MLKNSITLPTVPEDIAPPNKKELQELQLKKKLLRETNQSIDNIQERLKDTFKFICALRLDMVSDKLEKINPKLAQEIDEIANNIEKSTWI